MFGKKQIAELQSELEKIRREKADLEKDLEKTKARLNELETLVGDSDAETVAAQAKETIAEYEGLKKLYNDKIAAFEEKREGEEQQMARETALKRHHLDREIRENRQANQDFVAGTVKTFGETYNYYLSQIRVLMDALGKVAAQTGETLFEADTENLKAKFGQQMAEELKSGTEQIAGEEGDLILIGAPEEEPAEEAEEPAEDIAEEAAEAAEDAAEDITEAAEGAADAVETAAAETAEEAADAVEETIQNAAEDLA